MDGALGENREREGGQVDMLLTQMNADPVMMSRNAEDDSAVNSTRSVIAVQKSKEECSERRKTKHPKARGLHKDLPGLVDAGSLSIMQHHLRRRMSVSRCDMASRWHPRMVVRLKRMFRLLEGPCRILAPW